MPNLEKLDPRLRYLLNRGGRGVVEVIETLRMSHDEITPRNSVEVLIRCRKARGTLRAKSVRDKLKKAGVEVSRVIEGPDFIVTGTVPVDTLSSLTDPDWIAEVEAGRQLHSELDISGADVRVRSVQALPPPLRGRGVLIGVIDTGIDALHDDFRHADGSSRIRFIWDQNLTAIPGGTRPYGREFTKEDLDAALGASPRPAPIAHLDVSGHGTHVAGIAAGNGRASDGALVGMAPDAELIIVATRSDAPTLGQSNAALDAHEYIVARAQELGRPVAINQSQGMNGGGHSGESLLEVGMDSLARRPGVVIVKSAGNEQEWRIHAGGRLETGSGAVLTFEAAGTSSHDDILELWHDDLDEIAIAVQPPGAPSPVANDFKAPGTEESFSTAAGNLVRIISTPNTSEIGDVQTMIFLHRGRAPRVQPGGWRLHLRGDQIRDGRYDVWIERSPWPRTHEQARFRPESHDPSSTISIPGTARRIITVGAHVSRLGRGGTPVGNLSTFSSHGPTRYGLQKPEVTAPGEEIAAPLSSTSSGQPFREGYTLDLGTSMAAPHVTGAAALLLEINPALTCEQIKQLLARSARRDDFSASAPDDAWGGGKLDVLAAIEFARDVQFPAISGVSASGSVISWTTDLPTTGAVRFNTHQRRMLLGRSSGSRAVLTIGTTHSIDLADLPPGTYHCEILAFTEADWWTLDDNDGVQYQVIVE